MLACVNASPNPSLSEFLARLRAAPLPAAGPRIVLVDGPAGSGKSTLANALSAALGAPVIRGDDMYEGWEGLGLLWAVLGPQVLEPLARGEDAVFRRWDWVRGERAEEIRISAAADAVVVEGVGVAQRLARPHASLVVYVEAPWEVRLARGLERDGEAMREHWKRWQAVEEPFLLEEGVRDAADAVVDGTAPLPE